MMRCRICGSTKNLKYTPAEIRGSQKNKRLPLPLKEIANAINGNICKFCDLRLETFHKEASPVEIDITDDERICDMFYKRQIAQLAQTVAMRSLGSDGDPEIIEVLTSRETTPDIAEHTTNRQHSNTQTRIVDVIDLEDDESNDNLIETTVNRKPANEPRQENLLGCLSLVTSDSESSEINFEPCHKTTISKEKSPPINVNNNNKNDGETTAEQTFPICEVCGIRFLDTASLQVHTNDNHRIPCPVCSLHFKTELELVYHIRQKHRQYNGDKLCEGAKCAQDSAMTIRLRFEQSLTFYECQLCGNIDLQFKSHKEHIIENHPDESKSLRDPMMMKTKLSCPACHQKVGAHPVDLCRHLLAKHQEKYKKYIKEVTDLKALPTTNPKSIQKVKHSARVLAFISKTDDYFYECQLCKKIFGNFSRFLQHHNAHNIDEFNEYEGRKSGNFNASVRTKRKTDEHKVDNVKPKNKPDFDESCHKTKQVKTDKTKKLIKTPPKEAITSKKQDVVFKKPSKQAPTQIEQPNAAKTTTKTSVTDENKRQKKLKRRSKNGTTIVKVKAPLKHFPTQKYDCKNCQNTFKGYRKLNLHMLQAHSEEEFKRCSYCPKMFVNESRLSQHVSCSHTDAGMSRRKRKFTVRQPAESEKVDENFNKEQSLKRSRLLDKPSKKLKNQNIEEQPKTETSSAWLEEVYQLSWEKNMCNNSLNEGNQYFREWSKSDKEQLLKTTHYLCQYCARLFTDGSALSTHEQIHANAKDMPWIALDALNCV